MSDVTITAVAIDVEAGDQLADALQKTWGWFLAAGIISVLFGAVVLSYKTATLTAVAYLFGIWALIVGITQLIGGIRMVKHRLATIIMAIVSIGVGIATLVWPHVTLFVVATLIGWLLLLWGLVTLVGSLFSMKVIRHWWIGVIEGLIFSALGIWALRHPGNSLVVLLVIVGISSIISGIFQIIAAFSAKHAKANWESIKADAGV